MLRAFCFAPITTTLIPFILLLLLLLLLIHPHFLQPTSSFGEARALQQQNTPATATGASTSGVDPFSPHGHGADNGGGDGGDGLDGGDTATDDASTKQKAGQSGGAPLATSAAKQSATKQATLPGDDVDGSDAEAASTSMKPSTPPGTGDHVEGTDDDDLESTKSKKSTAGGKTLDKAKVTTPGEAISKKAKTNEPSVDGGASTPPPAGDGFGGGDTLDGGGGIGAEKPGDKASGESKSKTGSEKQPTNDKDKATAADDNATDGMGGDKGAVKKDASAAVDEGVGPPAAGEGKEKAKAKDSGSSKLLGNDLDGGGGGADGVDGKAAGVKPASLPQKSGADGVAKAPKAAATTTDVADAAIDGDDVGAGGGLSPKKSLGGDKSAAAAAPANPKDSSKDGGDGEDGGGDVSAAAAMKSGEAGSDAAGGLDGKKINSKATNSNKDTVPSPLASSKKAALVGDSEGGGASDASDLSPPKSKDAPLDASEEGAATSPIGGAKTGGGGDGLLTTSETVRIKSGGGSDPQLGSDDTSGASDTTSPTLPSTPSPPTMTKGPKNDTSVSPASTSPSATKAMSPPMIVKPQQQQPVLGPAKKPPVNSQQTAMPTSLPPNKIATPLSPMQLQQSAAGNRTGGGAAAMPLVMMPPPPPPKARQTPQLLTASPTQTHQIGKNAVHNPTWPVISQNRMEDPTNPTQPQAALMTAQQQLQQQQQSQRQQLRPQAPIAQNSIVPAPFIHGVVTPALDSLNSQNSNLDRHRVVSIISKTLLNTLNTGGSLNSATITTTTTQSANSNLPVGGSGSVSTQPAPAAASTAFAIGPSLMKNGKKQHGQHRHGGHHGGHHNNYAGGGHQLVANALGSSDPDYDFVLRLIHDTEVGAWEYVQSREEPARSIELRKAIVSVLAQVLVQLNRSGQIINLISTLSAQLGLDTSSLLNSPAVEWPTSGMQQQQPPRRQHKHSGANY